MEIMVLSQYVNEIGLLAGSAGICMAYFLAFVYHKRVPWRYTLGLFIFGAYMVLAHTQPLAPPNVSANLRALSIIGAMVGESIAFIWAINNARPNGDEASAGKSPIRL